MKVIAPLTMTDAILTSSNVPETDAPAWRGGTTYAAGAEVIVLATHRVYRSVIAGNIGNNPVTDDGTRWLDLGFTNRWRVFDGKVSALTEQTGSIVYEITPTTFVSGVGFINLGAKIVRVECFDATSTLIYSAEIDRFENSAIIDYYTFFTVDLTREDTSDVIFDDVKGFPGNRLVITMGGVNPLANVTVGQIVLGVAYDLGVALSNTAIGIRDFSSKGRDVFGNAVIVERAFADTVTFQFTLRSDQARRVRAILAGLRATPALYYAGADMSRFGAQAFGFFQDFEIPLDAGGQSFANLKIEGLT